MVSELGVENAEEYKSWKLKEKPKSHYGSRIVFATFKGQSDYVCSSDLSLGDALRLYNEINCTKTESASDSLSVTEAVQVNENQALHVAAGLLRKCMATIKDSATAYEARSMDMYDTAYIIDAMAMLQALDESKFSYLKD